MAGLYRILMATHPIVDEMFHFEAQMSTIMAALVEKSLSVETMSIKMYVISE